MSRRSGFSCIAARAVMAETTRRVSSRSSGKSMTCPNVVRNTGISPYGVTSVRTNSDVSDTRATPALLISLPPTTSVWGVKFKICFMNITTCTAWIWFFPYIFLKKILLLPVKPIARLFFCLFAALVHYQGERRPLPCPYPPRKRIHTSPYPISRCGESRNGYKKGETLSRTPENFTQATTCPAWGLWRALPAAWDCCTRYCAVLRRG